MIIELIPGKMYKTIAPGILDPPKERGGPTKENDIYLFLYAKTSSYTHEYHFLNASKTIIFKIRQSDVLTYFVEVS